MDIAGVGPSIAQQLIHEGLINDVADLYYLKLRRPDMLKLDRWDTKKVDTLLQQIEQRLILGRGGNERRNERRNERQNERWNERRNERRNETKRETERERERRETERQIERERER
jgi:hypothetical protein